MGFETLELATEDVLPLGMPIHVNVPVQVDGRAYILSGKLIPLDEDAMQRDMDLIKKIMLQIEAKEDLEPRPISLKEYESIIVDRHAHMLFKSGFIEGNEHATLGMPCPKVMATDLSWEGHEFIAILKNDHVWKKIKQKFSTAEVAAIPLEIIKDTGMAMVKAWVKEKLG